MAIFDPFFNEEDILLFEGCLVPHFEVYAILFGSWG